MRQVYPELPPQQMAYLRELKDMEPVGMSPLEWEALARLRTKDLLHFCGLKKTLEVFLGAFDDTKPLRPEDSVYLMTILKTVAEEACKQ